MAYTIWVSLDWNGGMEWEQTMKLKKKTSNSNTLALGWHSRILLKFLGVKDNVHINFTSLYNYTNIETLLSPWPAPTQTWKCMKEPGWLGSIYIPRVIKTSSCEQGCARTLTHTNTHTHTHTHTHTNKHTDTHTYTQTHTRLQTYQGGWDPLKWEPRSIGNLENIVEMNRHCIMNWNCGMDYWILVYCEWHQRFSSCFSSFHTTLWDLRRVSFMLVAMYPLKLIGHRHRSCLLVVN